MSYGNQSWVRNPAVSTDKRKLGFDDDFVNIAFLAPAANYLNRTGTNHTKDTSPISKNLRYSFSKDGKELRVLVGTQRVPIRKYRWVGSGKNRHREYYITYVVKRRWINIPRPTYSYRNINAPKSALYLLKPNRLSTSWSDTIYPPPVYFSMNGGQPPTTASYDVQTGGQMSGTLEPASNISFGSRRPFSLISYAATSAQRKKVDQDALRSLYERVASRFPDVGTMVGESKESLSMLRKLANEGASFLADLLKKDKARLAGRLKAPADFASSAWLTYVYGVKPLINDIVALQELPNQYGIRTYTRAAILKHSTSSNPINTGLSKWISNLRYSLEVKYGVIMSADLKGSQRYSALNLTNPIGVGYQLIPFSFMLDWFYDLGGFLNQQSALQYGFLYGWKTVTEKTEYLDFQSGANTHPWWQVPVGINLPYHRNYGNCTRVILSKNSFPMMPTPKLDLWQDNSIRGLNALAIAVSLHGKSK